MRLPGGHVKKQDKTMYKCEGCQVATYCCSITACCIGHSTWEMQRTCDHPECDRRAKMEIRCRQCNVATYCSEEH